MEPSKLLNANYLDIIFDNRNKAYGGYELRQHYNRRVIKAVGFLLLGLGAAVSFSFITTHKSEQLHVRTFTVAPKIIDMALPKPVPKLAEPARPSTPPQHIKTIAFTPPIITNDPITPAQQTIIPMDTTMAGPTTTDGGAMGSINDTKGKGTGVIDQQPSHHSEPVSWVPQMPQFNGDMYAYISAHLRYPEAARVDNIAGEVLIKFVVNEDGSVSDATVVHGIGGGCDEEALKMVSTMPKWKPGKQNGIPVKVFFSLPVRFMLD